MIAIKNTVAAFVCSLVVVGVVPARGAEGEPQSERSYRFIVIVEDQARDLGTWSKVTGLDVTWDLAEYRSGGAANVSRLNFPGITKFGTVTLQRASSAEADLVFAWLQDMAATGDRPTLTIILLDQTGEPVVRWQLENVFPHKYTIGGLDTEGKDVAIETLVLSHVGLSVECVRGC